MLAGTLTPEACAAAVAAHRLGQACIDAEPVEPEASALHDLAVQLSVELALGHAIRAARAREAQR